MDLPTDRTEVEALIRNEVQENISLDYKASGAIDSRKRREIAKDVSAFANSAGGILIYGVSEVDHLPVKIDEGVDHSRYSREWLEQVIMTGISPRIGDLRIAQIPISGTRSLFAVQVGQTVRGPHLLNGDGRYYKRFDFSSVPMEQFEIEDVRSRSSRFPSLVLVDVAIEGSTLVFLTMKNPSDVAAENVRFRFDPAVSWEDGDTGPRMLMEGARRFPPGREMRFFYASFPEIVEGKAGRPSSLVVEVTYLHPRLGAELRDEFVIDFMDYLHSSGITPDVVRAAERVERVLKELQRDTRMAVEHLRQMAGGTSATGVTLSVPTLRSLRAIAQGEQELDKICADHASYGTFKEVLQLDHSTAHRLYRHFNFGQREDGQSIEEVEGVTPEVLESLRRHFYSLERDI